MAANENFSPKESIGPSLPARLAQVLPKDVKFGIYHLSTPPTRASALFSPPPGARPDRTYCESHFLTSSIQITSSRNTSELDSILVFAIEVLIYSTADNTTLFVSKADSTGFLHLLNLPKETSSPLKDISATFLSYLVEQRQRPNIRSVVSLFARAQDQYLFPGSIEYSGKHVLDDRGLVRWWCKVLNPLIEGKNGTQWENTEGFLMVPGLDSHETRSFIPRSTKSSWTIGHPLQQISRHPFDIPPRCLIPHYPDDPKARYLDELDDEINKGGDSESGQWKSIKSIDQFWEMMAFRQECSAGRLVGFIWIVFTPRSLHGPSLPAITDSQSTIVTADTGNTKPLPAGSFSSLPLSPPTFEASNLVELSISPLKVKDANISTSSQQTSTRKIPKPKKTLSGKIIPRQPRIKTSNKNKNYLLDKPERTAYYNWRQEGRGQVIVDETDYKRVTELLLRLDFANLELASSSSQRWICEVRAGAWGNMCEEWGKTVIGTKATSTQTMASAAGVNTLNMGLVRKKRKAGAEETKEVETSPVVNVLSGRKKTKV
jgi:regulator of Ty1 transposition protein 109